MKRVTILFAVLLLLVLATASPAAAKPIPYFDRDFEELSDPFYDLCPFGVMYHGYGHESYREWQDADGFPIMGQFQRHGTDAFINEETGTTVSGRYRFTSHLSDWTHHAVADTWTWQERLTGVWWNIQLPSEGAVWHTSGQAHQTAFAPFEDPATWVYTVTDFVGNDVFDPEALCEALAE